MVIISRRVWGKSEELEQTSVLKPELVTGDEALQSGTITCVANRTSLRVQMLLVDHCELRVFQSISVAQVRNVV